MKYCVIVFSCAIAAFSQTQMELDGRPEDKLLDGQRQVEIVDDISQHVPYPTPKVSGQVSGQVYGPIPSPIPIQNQYLNGIPLAFRGTLFQNQNQYDTNQKLYNQQDIPWINCGSIPCPRTWFVCQIGSCQYPIEFDDLILRSRSSLQRGERQFQSIANLLLSVSGKTVRDGASIQVANAKILYDSTRSILSEAAENIASLDQFMSNDVIGPVAQDVLVDQEDLHAALTVLADWLTEVDHGKEPMIPIQVYDRSFRPKDWTPTCSGRWPCTRIILYPSRYAYSQQKNACSCQRLYPQYGPQVASQIYQQPVQTFRQGLPLQILTQPQQTFSQPLQQQMFTQSTQLFPQSQFQTIRYEPSMTITSDVEPPKPNGVFSSALSKNLMSTGPNVQQLFTQPQPLYGHSHIQQVFSRPQYQTIIRPYQQVYGVDTDNSTNSNVQSTIFYSQPQYQTTKIYRPAVYSSPGSETLPNSDRSHLDDSNNPYAAFTQFTQEPKYVEAQQVKMGQPQYQTIKQYQTTMYAPRSLQPSTIFGASMMKRADNSTEPQQPVGESQQQGFVQFQKQFFTQPQYTTVKQYQPAIYSTGSRLLQTDSDLNASLMRSQDNFNSSDGQPLFAGSQQSQGFLQSQQFLTQQKYPMVKQYKPAMMIPPAMKSRDNSTYSNGLSSYAESQQTTKTPSPFSADDIRR